ncbi:hypothetical protein HMPREF1640_06280 [Prevotella sp. S7-1-8]|nr:hypothetical protein HMPREF1640_06280 [Prevotella sp. S7-1-8]
MTRTHTEYDLSKSLPEKEKIKQVRQFFIAEGKKSHKIQMPWWMGETVEPNLKFITDIDSDIKRNLINRSFILFKSMYSANPNLKYKYVAIWLCSHYSLLCSNMRDFYSAGGKIKEYKGVVFNPPLPQIVGNLLRRVDEIKSLLDNPDKDLLQDISDYWDFEYNETDLFGSWVNMLEEQFKGNAELKKINIRKLIYSQTV